MNDNPTMFTCQCSEQVFVSVSYTRISHNRYVKFYSMERPRREIARCPVCGETLYEQWEAQYDSLS